MTIICSGCLESFETSDDKRTTCNRCISKKVRKFLPDIECPYCKDIFTPRTNRTVVCGKKKCKKQRNIDRTIAKRDGTEISSPTAQEKARQEYDEALKSKFKIENFTYSKLLAKCLKQISGNKKGVILKHRQVQAMRLVQKIIGNMNPKSERTKLILLERDYIRELELERLRINIKRKLNVDSIEGDYTLSEVGSVLGVTRERTRQLEVEANKIMHHPSAARVLRDYTYSFDVEDA